MCHCYNLVKINYFDRFSISVKYNAITNVLLLFKHFFLSFLCAVIGCKCIKYYDGCRCTCWEDERPCIVPPCRCIKHFDGCRCTCWEDERPCRCIKYCDGCRCTCWEDERPCIVPPCRCIKHFDGCRCTCWEDERPYTVLLCRCKDFRCRNRAVTIGPSYLEFFI